MLTENCVQITLFDLLESFKFQFLASYLYHCVCMILIHSSEMQSFISVGVTQLFTGQINIYMAFCITSHVILINYKIVINCVMFGIQTQKAWVFGVHLCLKSLDFSLHGSFLMNPSFFASHLKQLGIQLD